MDLVLAEEGAPPVRLQQRMGQLPIMVKSRACYLRNLSQCALHAAVLGNDIASCILGQEPRIAQVQLVALLCCKVVDPTNDLHRCVTPVCACPKHAEHKSSISGKQRNKFLQ